MDARLRTLAATVTGFMPEHEGLALYRCGLSAGPGPWIEIGSYCGKSTVYLGAAAREQDATLFTIDHHRGSEEHQPGWEFHDPALADAEGRLDTLPRLRETLARAELEPWVIAIVGRSRDVARHWSTPLGLVFIDGSHTEESARADYEGWAPHVSAGGLLVIHDVFMDPAAGGQAPRHVYERALESGDFREEMVEDTLRALRRV